MAEIKWYEGTDEGLTDALYIRKKVFMEEQNVSEEDEIDDEGDKKSHHIVIYEDKKPVATGRLLIDKGECIIGRMAVIKEYRGKKLGKFTMEEIIKKANELGYKKQTIHAQFYAKDFYKGLGFIEYGEKYMDAGIEHIDMYHECS